MKEIFVKKTRPQKWIHRIIQEEEKKGLIFSSGRTSNRGNTVLMFNTI